MMLNKWINMLRYEERNKKKLRLKKKKRWVIKRWRNDSWLTVSAIGYGTYIIILIDEVSFQIGGVSILAICIHTS